MSFLLPEAGLLFWMLIAFGVVFFILYKYGFPVITSMIDERKKFIDEALDNAKIANEKLAGIEEQSRLILEKANAEQVRILREAVVARDCIVKEAQEKAELESAKIISAAKEQIKQEKEDALREIRAQVAELSIAIAEKVIRKELADDKAHDSFMDSLLDESIDARDKNVLLKSIIEKFNGGPVGIEALASSIGEEVSTIEDVYEPYLLQCGFLKRTPRGRVVTEKGYRQVNMTYQNTLFDLESSD